MSFTGNERVQITDEHGHELIVTLGVLADYILSRKAVSTSKLSWTCDDRYFYNYPVVFDTSDGPYQKASYEPAIITYVKYDCYKKRKKRSELMSTVIFLARSPDGVSYYNRKDELNEEWTSFDYKGNTWYYNLIRKPIILTGQSVIKPFTLKTYPSFNEALIDILDNASVRDGIYYSGFCDKEDIAFMVGATSPEKEEYAPFQVDNFGNVYCNSIITRGETYEN